MISQRNAEPIAFVINCDRSQKCNGKVRNATINKGYKLFDIRVLHVMSHTSLQLMPKE